MPRKPTKPPVSRRPRKRLPRVYENNILAWREYRGLSQDKLIDKVHERISTFSKTSLSRLENGVARGGEYRQSVIEALAWALDCRPTDLIEWPPDHPRAKLAAELRQIPDSEIGRIAAIIGTFRPPGK